MRGLITMFPFRRLPAIASILEVVLSYLRRSDPMLSLTLDMLQAKCLFLVAVASGRRVSELAHLGGDQPFLHLTTSSVSLIYTPVSIAKNEDPTSLQAPLVVNSVSATAPEKQERLVCPVRAIYYWREFITKNSNRDRLQLF